VTGGIKQVNLPDSQTFQQTKEKMTWASWRKKRNTTAVTWWRKGL